MGRKIILKPVQIFLVVGAKIAHFSPIMVLSPAAAVQSQLFYSPKLESTHLPDPHEVHSSWKDWWLFRVGMHNYFGVHKIFASKSPYWAFELPENVINLVIAVQSREWNQGGQSGGRGYALACVNCCMSCAMSVEFVESVCFCLCTSLYKSVLIKHSVKYKKITHKIKIFGTRWSKSYHLNEWI